MHPLRAVRIAGYGQTDSGGHGVGWLVDGSGPPVDRNIADQSPSTPSGPGLNMLVGLVEDGFNRR